MGETFVALLRGINVGGNNIIPMADLRDTFTATGATDVATYIQSGNVLFDGGRDDHDTWVERLEAALAERFGYHARVTLRSHRELRAIVGDARPGSAGIPMRTDRTSCSCSARRPRQRRSRGCAPVMAWTR